MKLGKNKIITSRWKQNDGIYHTDPDCYRIDRMKNPKIRDKRSYEGRECKDCSGVDYRKDSYRLRKCRVCGAMLDSEGSCYWCKRCEELGIE